MLSLTRVLDNYSTKKTEVKKFQIPHPNPTHFQPCQIKKEKRKKKKNPRSNSLIKKKNHVIFGKSFG